MLIKPRIHASTCAAVYAPESTPPFPNMTFLSGYAARTAATVANSRSGMARRSLHFGDDVLLAAGRGAENDTASQVEPEHRADDRAAKLQVRIEARTEMVEEGFGIAGDPHGCPEVRASALHRGTRAMHLRSRAVFRLLNGVAATRAACCCGNELKYTTPGEAADGRVRTPVPGKGPPVAYRRAANSGVPAMDMVRSRRVHASCYPNRGYGRDPRSIP